MTNEKIAAITAQFTKDIGDIGLGVAKLLLGWLTFGIWPLIDIFLCYKKAKEYNYQKLTQAIVASSN